MVLKEKDEKKPIVKKNLKKKLIKTTTSQKMIYFIQDNKIFCQINRNLEIYIFEQFIVISDRFE